MSKCAIIKADSIASITSTTSQSASISTTVVAANGGGLGRKKLGSTGSFTGTGRNVALAELHKRLEERNDQKVEEERNNNEREKENDEHYNLEGEEKKKRKVSTSLRKKLKKRLTSQSVGTGLGCIQQGKQ